MAGARVLRCWAETQHTCLTRERQRLAPGPHEMDAPQEYPDSGDPIDADLLNSWLDGPGELPLVDRRELESLVETDVGEAVARLNTLFAQGTRPPVDLVATAFSYAVDDGLIDEATSMYDLLVLERAVSARDVASFAFTSLEYDGLVAAFNVIGQAFQAGIEFDHSVCADLVECLVADEPDPLVLVPEGLLDGISVLIDAGMTDLDSLWWPMLKGCLDTPPQSTSQLATLTGFPAVRLDSGGGTRFGAVRSLIGVMHERGMPVPVAVVNQFVDRAYAEQCSEELSALGILLRHVGHPAALDVIADAMSFPRTQN